MERVRVRVDNMEEFLQELQKALERLEKEGVETSIYTNPATFFVGEEVLDVGIFVADVEDLEKKFEELDYQTQRDIVEDKVYETLSTFFGKLGWREEEGDDSATMCGWVKGDWAVSFVNEDPGNPPYITVEKIIVEEEEEE